MNETQRSTSAHGSSNVKRESISLDGSTTGTGWISTEWTKVTMQSGDETAITYELHGEVTGATVDPAQLLIMSPKVYRGAERSGLQLAATRSSGTIDATYEHSKDKDNDASQVRTAVKAEPGGTEFGVHT
jgi:hypothetical protein